MLRRVATLVAERPPGPELFDAVAAEVMLALPVSSVALGRYEQDGAVTLLTSADAPIGASLAERVRAGGRAARSDDGSAPAVGVPITVDDAVWGLIGVAADGEPPPSDEMESRLADFSALVAMAISSAESRARLRRLADEQAAVRRVATLVAEDAPAAELFDAVLRELAQALDVPGLAVLRYEPDRAATVVASRNAPAFPIGRRHAPDAEDVVAAVRRTGRAARAEDGSEAGVPIVVEERVWGLIRCGAPGTALTPASAETVLGDFAELVAISISNALSRDRLRLLADQQASLGRVATLVAEGAAPTALFTAVAEEVARMLDVASARVVRYESGAAVVVASVNDPGFPVGSSFPLDAPGLFTTVFATERPARIDDYSTLEGPVGAAARTSGAHSGVGVPIVVDGRVWGAVAVGRVRPRTALPAFTGSYTGRIVLAAESADEIEDRLAAFTELVATAISKAQTHDDLLRLAEEQAALRRVATLVAEVARPEELFGAVAAEVGRILGLSRVEMVRYEPDGTGTVIGASGDHPFPTGTNWVLDGPSIMAAVLQTGRPARIDSYEELGGTIAEVARGAGFRSAIGAPIVVDGRTWGTIIAISTDDAPIPARSEVRLSQFTELVATAVSNTTARSDLIASRARIVAAGDEARRRIERDLHDGTQQRLLALGLDLQRVSAEIPDDQPEARSGLEQVARDLEAVIDEVRELSRGVHPAGLARGGLGPSLRALARRSPIPVAVDVDVGERPPPTVETAVYYVVSEAVTNAIRYSGAAAISVSVVREGDVVRATIADDGSGGAEPGVGSGLTGLSDRVEALGGRFALASPPGIGTTISAELPIGAAES